jgi:uncharacterized membrane protein
MAYCSKCGSQVAENAAFCGNCGSPQSVASPASSGAPSANPSPATAPVSVTPAAPAQTQMAENVAGMLCYLLGWLTGLIFFLIDKRPFVRFHAAQSIVVFGGLHILTFALGALFGLSFLTGGWMGFSLGFGLYRLLDIVILVLWVLLMVRAYQGQHFRVPVAANIAESIFGKL